MNVLEHIRALNQAAVTPISMGLGMENLPIEQDISAGYSVAAIDEALAAVSDAEIAEAYKQLGDGSRD